MNLDASYRLCEKIARTRARNFYFGFLPLPRAKRRAMCAVYAFMRYCDDLADEDSVHDRQGKLDAWRRTLRQIAAGDTSAHPMLPAFRDTLQRFQIPIQYFEDVVSGAEMDLSITRYETFEQLYGYCYHVASVVGLTCLHIFGFQDPAALPLGEACGIAFQLTNILRDVREDASGGRIYLPNEDLERFGCSPGLLASSSLPAPVVPLLRFEAARAQSYYEKALPLLELVDRDARGSLSALICIYHAVLRQIRSEQFDVFSHRVSVPALRKIGFVLRCWIWPERTVRVEVGK